MPQVWRRKVAQVTEIILWILLSAWALALLYFCLFHAGGPTRRIYQETFCWDDVYAAHAKALLSGPTGCPTRPLPPTPTRLVKAPEGPRVDPLRLWSMYGPFI